MITQEHFDQVDPQAVAQKMLENMYCTVEVLENGSIRTVPPGLEVRDGKPAIRFQPLNTAEIVVVDDNGKEIGWEELTEEEKLATATEIVEFKLGEKQKAND
jgi:hypothetical protein